MAIDVTQFYDASYLKPHKKTFFPLKIEAQHPQLRHYLSVGEGGILYYASGHDVWALHTKLQRRERMATLAFVPQCMVAGYGWICVGGLTGRFAFINISEAQPFDYGRASASLGGEVDELLPLNLDPHPRDPSEPMETNQYSYRPAWARAVLHCPELGHDIVNSITLHKLRSTFEGVEDEDLAVISSNDKTVRIFSLSQKKHVKTLRFHLPMNHATISPDGTTLVACGDDMAAFFIQRKDLDRPTGSFLVDRYDWIPKFSCSLDPNSRGDTCFSTAFSPTGHLCTIASQFGIVNVFDTQKLWDGLEDGEAVIDTFTSSRPAIMGEDARMPDMPGAIRSTAFAPNPWDLFAWAEDQGRVCVADIRSGFRSRELIELDIKAKSFEEGEVVHIEDTENAEMRDLEREASMLRRQRYAADASASINSTADYIQHAAWERRRRQEQTSRAHDPNPHELTEADRQILETLRVERLRESAAAESRQDSSVPYSINYTGTPLASMSNESIRQYMQARNHERNSSSSTSRAFNPRRQSSIVITNSNNNQPSNTSTSSLAPLSNATHFSTSPSRLGSSSTSHTPAPLSPNSSRPTSFSTTVPSLIPAPTSADPWASISTALNNSASPRPANSPPTVSATSSSIDPTTSINEHSFLQDLSLYRGMLDDHSDARRRSPLATASTDRHHTRTTAQTSSNLSNPIPELEEARAQIVRLPAQVEADADDVVRQLRHSALEQARTRRNEGIAARLSGIQQIASNFSDAIADDDNTDSRVNVGSISRLTTALDRDRDRGTVWGRDGRMDDVRLAQYRRLQDRALGLGPHILEGSRGSAARNIGLSGDDLIATASESYMSSMAGTEREHGAAVMGMAWGHGGRELFVATEEGIFAFEMDLDKRKQFPVIKFR